MSFWSERIESKNPVFPFEWALEYANGSLFRRKEGNLIRTTLHAPKIAVAMRVYDRDEQQAFCIAAPTGFDEVVAVSRVVRPLNNPCSGTVSHWRFGFKRGDRFFGVVIQQDGKVKVFD